MSQFNAELNPWNESLPKIAPCTFSGCILKQNKCADKLTMSNVTTMIDLFNHKAFWNLFRAIFNINHLSSLPCSYLGSGGPSDSGFIDSLQRERKTRKASFWRMWENLAPGSWPGAAPDSCRATDMGDAAVGNSFISLNVSYHQPNDDDDDENCDYKLLDISSVWSGLRRSTIKHNCRLYVAEEIINHILAEKTFMLINVPQKYLIRFHLNEQLGL